jgi:hypothetical protein
VEHAEFRVQASQCLSGGTVAGVSRFGGAPECELLASLNTSNRIGIAINFTWAHRFLFSEGAAKQLPVRQGAPYVLTNNW